MIIKNRCVYTVLLASFMCLLGCSHSGAKSEGVLHKKVFYYDDIESEFQITVDNSWERLEIAEDPFDSGTSMFLMRFRSEKGCLIGIFIDQEHGTMHFRSDQDRTQYEEKPLTVHHSLFDMDIYSSDNDFMGLTDLFSCEEYSLHLIIEGSCNVPRNELEALVLSIKIESP